MRGRRISPDTVVASFEVTLGDVSTDNFEGFSAPLSSSDTSL